MSLAAVRWALGARASRRLTHTERLVLVALADYTATDSAECWPAQSLVADRLDLDAGSVRRAVAALTDLGLVVKLKRGRSGRGLGTWTYRLSVENPVDYRAPARGTSDSLSAHQRAVQPESYRAESGDVPRASARAEALEAKQPTRARAREDRDPARRNAAVDNRGSAGTARPPAPTPVELHWPTEDERERVRALNAAERARRTGRQDQP